MESVITNIEIEKEKSEHESNQNDLNQALKELNSRIIKLEEQQIQNKETFSNIIDETAKNEKSLRRLIEKLSFNKKNLDYIISDLWKKLNTLETNITQSEIKYGTSFNEVVDWEQKIKEKNIEIERQKILLEQSKIQIEIDKKDIDRTIIYKDQAIFKLTSDLEYKINEINTMKDIIENLEGKISEISKTPIILNKIKKVMVIKGFITEKELEDIIESKSEKLS